MILYENYGKTQKRCLQFYILSSKYFLPLLSLAEFLQNLNKMCIFGRFLYIFGYFSTKTITNMIYLRELRQNTKAMFAVLYSLFLNTF